MTRKRRHSRGFTLVELMVAVTGGLFVAIVVFALARDGARFYQRESRISDATMSAIVGFERLRADISRAGFLATPNARFDPKLCHPSLIPSWPAGIQNLASIRITPGGSPASAVLQANGLSPDALLLAGSYTSNDQFAVWNIVPQGGDFAVFLQWQTGPLARLGYGAATAAEQQAMLASIFGVGRGLRIQDQAGEIQFGTIKGVQGGAQPQIVLGPAPALQFRQNAAAVCGLKGNVTGATVNVVNFIRYDVRSLASDPNYAPLYGGPNPHDASRTELVRVELDTAGAEIQGTQELAAEYAVDFSLGVTVNVDATGTNPTLQTFAPGNAAVANWGNVLTNLNQGPHRIRGVRVRLSVRSQEADRDAPIVAGGSIAPGLYRIGLGNAGGAPFARVRTVQADLALHNQMGVTW